MRIETLKSRIGRLQVGRHASRWDHLDRDGLERELFTRLHRLATQAGGLDELLAQWDAETDPGTLAITAKVRPYVESIRDHYVEMEARLCSPH